MPKFADELTKAKNPRRSGPITSHIAWLSVCVIAAAWGGDRLLDPQWQNTWALFGVFGLLAALGLTALESRTTRADRADRLLQNG